MDSQEQCVWLRYGDRAQRFTLPAKENKLDVKQAASCWSLDPSTVCVGHHLLHQDERGLSIESLDTIREWEEGDGKSHLTAIQVRGGGQYETFAAHVYNMSKTMTSVEIFTPRNVLTFPNGIPFLPDTTSNTKSLWIHTSYPSLAAELTTGKVRSHHLLGTSGTGKSTFGLLWLLSLALIRRKVLFRSRDKSWILYDFSATTFTTQIFTTYGKALRYVDSSVWLIVDGPSKPILHPGPVLQCVTGPFHGYVDFAQALGGRLLYMQPWSLEDCELCYSDLHLPVDDIYLRYFYAGGIPRYLLNEAAYGIGDLRNSVNAAGLSVHDWEFLFTSAWKGEISERLVHFRYGRMLFNLNEQGEEYTTIRECFPASEYARTVIHSGLMYGSARTGFINRLRGICEAGGLREAVFERVVHEELSRGGEFTMRALADKPRGGEFQKSIRPKRAASKYFDTRTGFTHVYAEVFTSREQVHLKDKLPLEFIGWEDYVKEVTRTEDGLDSLVTPGRIGTGMIFRITVRPERGIKWTYVEQVIGFLDEWCQKQGRAPPPKYWLVFVVPEEESHRSMKIELSMPTGCIESRLEYYILFLGV